LTTAKLLEIPQSHAVLRPLLPSLGNLVHDKKEKVRLAAVKLLHHVKQTRGIHFYHVVPVEHLCARLSEEAAHRDAKSAVNKELTALMLSSYFPQGEDVTAGDQIQRTIAFLLTDPLAAASFYANLADFLDVESVAKFIAMLLACVKSAVQSDQAEQAKRTETKKKRRRANAPPDDQSNNSQKLSAANPDLMVGLVETIHTLIESVSSALDQPDNEPSKKLVHNRLREADLLNTLTHFEQRARDGQSVNSSERAQLEKNFRICRAILRCISFVPKKVIPGVADFIADSLEGISSDENISPSYALSHLSLLARWGLEDEVASAIASSIELVVNDRLSLTLLSPNSQSGFTSDHSKPSNRKKKLGQASASLLPEFSAHFAFEILHLVLSGHDPCALYIRGKILVSDEATTAIDSVLLKALKFAERILSTQPVSSYHHVCFNISPYRV
jgi:condensin-2 complex subunit G2